MMVDHTMCVGLFHDRMKADAAVDDLRSQGISRDDISVVARGREGLDRFRGWDDRGEYVSGEHQDVSAGEGAAVGGLTGLLIGAGLMLIPGVGPILAVGPLAAGLAGAVTGAVAGAVTGGVAGGLIDLGVPEEEARYYERQVGEGAFLVTVNCQGRDDSEIRSILYRHGAENVTDDAAGLTSSATGANSSFDRSNWDDVMPTYRSGWQQRFGSRGGQWSDYEPAYRYGWEKWNQPTYRGRAWAEVEPDLRRDWETRHHDKPWDRMGEAIHDAWDSLTGGHHDQGRVATDRLSSERPVRGTTGESVQLREEQLRANKETVQTGEVRVGKKVVTERQSVEVPVTREEVYVERHPVEGRPATGDIGASASSEIRVPVHEEQVNIEKRPVVTEEISVGKRALTETEHHTGTVRREEAVIDTDGDVDINRRGDLLPGDRDTGDHSSFSKR